MKLVGFVIYVALTGIVLLHARFEFLHATLMAGRNFLWILGPPATFTLQTAGSAWIVYMIESVICLTAFWVAVDSNRFRTAASVVLVVFWILSGLLPYAASI